MPWQWREFYDDLGADPLPLLLYNIMTTKLSQVPNPSLYMPQHDTLFRCTTAVTPSAMLLDGGEKLHSIVTISETAHSFHTLLMASLNATSAQLISLISRLTTFVYDDAWLVEHKVQSLVECNLGFFPFLVDYCEHPHVVYL